MNMYDYICSQKNILVKILENFKNIDLKKYNRICILATGSSFNAALSTKYYLENKLNKNIILLEPFNYINYSKFDNDIDLYILISQSGKSASIINSFDYIKSKSNVDTLVISSNKDCYISKSATYFLDLNMGIEKVGFVTLGFSATVLNLMLLGLYNSFNYEKEISNIKELIKNYDEIIKYANEKFEENEEKLKKAKRYSCIAYGDLYGIAKEFETKFTETVRFPSVGYELEAYMHGPYLEVNNNHFLFFLNYNDNNFERSNKLKKYMEKYTNNTISFNLSEINLKCNIENYMASLIMAVIVQVFSYRVSKIKNIDLSIKIMSDFDEFLKSKI